MSPSRSPFDAVTVDPLNNCEVAAAALETIGQRSEAVEPQPPTRSESEPLGEPSTPTDAETCVQLAMREYNFSFALEALDELEGFLICEDGYRRIVIAQDLPVSERIFLYFHMLAHIFFSHIGSVGLHVRTELRDRRALNDAEHYEEFLADMWAEDWLNAIVKGEHPQDSSVLQLLRAVLERRKSRGSPLQHKLHYWVQEQYEKHTWMLRLRNQRRMKWIIPRLYRHLDTDRSTLPAPQRLLSPLVETAVSVAIRRGSAQMPRSNLHEAIERAHASATRGSGRSSDSPGRVLSRP